MNLQGQTTGSYKGLAAQAKIDWENHPCRQNGGCERFHASRSSCRVNGECVSAGDSHDFTCAGDCRIYASWLAQLAGEPQAQNTQKAA